MDCLDYLLDDVDNHSRIGSFTDLLNSYNGLFQYCKENKHKKICYSLTNYHAAGFDSLFNINFEYEFENNVPFFIQDSINFDDYRINPETGITWNEWMFEDDIEAVNSTINMLLDKAITEKTACIPPSAICEINIGPYEYILINELSDWVCFTFYTKKVDIEFSFHTKDTRDFTQIGFRISDRKWFFGKTFTYGFDLEAEGKTIMSWLPKRYCLTEEEFEFIHKNGVSKRADDLHDKHYQLMALFRNDVINSLKILLSGILHDFWTVEFREKIFGGKRIKSNKERWMSVEEDGATIVYLPKIKYINQPNTKAFVQHVSDCAKNEIFVGNHIRKLPGSHKYSESAHLLAKAYGIVLPQNYTFVSAYKMRKEKREKIFKSKTALECIYNFCPQPNLYIKPKWEKFEIDVRTYFINNGYEILSWSMSGRADKGIDIEAVRSTNDITNVLLIQCKCWNTTKAIRPAVIREMVGAKHDYCQRKGIDAKWVNTAIVTTSYYTKDCLEIAKSLNVKLYISLIKNHEVLDLKEISLPEVCIS